MTAPRKRRKTSLEAKTAVMGGALLLTGIFEFFENLDEGDNALTAAGKAYDKTKLQGKAIRDAARRVHKKIEE
jgi:hypothetical protein